jgi:tetratricopeptide (TPR) repeat protein
MDRAEPIPTPPDRLRRVAVALLRAGQLEAAASCYKELWDLGNGPEVGARLLECLCELKRYAEALPVADELAAKYPDSPACREQVFSAWYGGRILARDPGCSYEQLTVCANALVCSGLYTKQAPSIILELANEAARREQWDTVLAVTRRLTPGLMRGGRLATWYDCRLQALLGKGEAAHALAIVHDLPDRFTHERRRFLTHLLRAYLLLDSPYDAAAVYVELSHHHSPPAWVFFEHGRLERDVGRNGDAIVLLSRAMLFTRPLTRAIPALEDLAELTLKLGWFAAARDHLRLNAWLRQVNGRLVPDRLRDLLERALAGCHRPEAAVPDKNAVLSRCRAIWRHQASRSLPVRRDVRHARRCLIDHLGTIHLENEVRLVQTRSGPKFPVPLELVPAGMESGADVVVDAIPSFDRARRVETWRVVGLRRA